MTPASPHGRRASDQPPNDVPRADLGKLLREWVLPLATVCTVLGGQVVHYEQEQTARRDRDAATADALTIIGRERCSALSAPDAARYGYPCGTLLGGNRWPLVRTVASSTAIRPPAPAPALPVRASTLLAVLFVPVLPLR